MTLALLTKVNTHVIFSNSTLHAMNKYTSVCIVEDTDHIRDILHKRINETEDLFGAGSFESAEEAISKMPKIKPDIAIMDIGLPGKNGIQCMMELKDQCPDTAFLMFTVFDNDEHVFDALKAGASGYILKDEKPSGVITAIRSYVSGGAPMSAEIAKKVLQSFHKSTAVHPDVEALTDHQRNILDQISKGKLNKEIAALLGITEGSIKVQINRIYKKLHVNNRVEAINKYLGNI